MRSRRFRCAGRNERRYYKYVPMLLEADGAAPRRRFHQHARRDGGSCMYNTQGRVLIILYLMLLDICMYYYAYVTSTSGLCITCM